MSPINKLSLLPKLSPFVERVFGGENVTWGGGGFEDRGGEVSVNENTATTTPSKDNAENVTVVRPALMLFLFCLIFHFGQTILFWLNNTAK